MHEQSSWLNQYTNIYEPTTMSLLHSSLSATSLFQITLTKFPFSSLSSSLSPQPCFTVPGLPLSLNVHQLSQSHDISWPCTLFLLSVVRMSSILLCSLIHDALFLFLSYVKHHYLHFLLFQNFRNTQSFRSICCW